MTTLTRNGRPIASAFALLGDSENDLTMSLGFALAKSPRFLTAFNAELGYERAGDWIVRLQTFGPDRGFTDVELEAPGHAFAIMEAKRGWAMPEVAQLERYLPRLVASTAFWRALVTVSDCSGEYAGIHKGIPARLADVPVLHLSWSRIVDLVNTARRGERGAAGMWLREFANYLDEVITVRREDSNLVYCVSLAAGTPDGWAISWREIVEKHRRYFHPAAKNWPADPPTYLAFRYDARLQSIHHVDDAKVVTRMSDHIPGIPAGEWEPHFLYTLGPKMQPLGEVKNGSIWPAGRYWCMLDLLLTAATVRDARDLTKRRVGAAQARRLAQTEQLE